MRIAHLSDFHYTKLTANPFRLFPKRIFCHLNWLLFRKKSFSFDQVDQLPSLFQKLKVDLILLGGDMTSSALPQEFLLAKNFLQNLKSTWIAVPGNHDHYSPKSLPENQGICTSKLLSDGVDVSQIAPSWWVVSLDTSCPNSITSSRGLFSLTSEEKLREALSKIPSNDRIILLNHYPFFNQDDPKRSLTRASHLEALIQKYPNIALYLHGHTHRHSVADLRPSQLPIVLDSGSCSMKSGTWNLIDIQEKGCSITPYQFDSRWSPKNTEVFAWM